MLVSEYVGTLARRVGGQVAAALVAVGMAVEHQAAVAAVVAWGVVTLGEVAISRNSRKKLVLAAKDAWGHNR